MLVDFYVLQWRNTYKLKKRVCVANKNQTQILVSVEKYKPGLLYFFRTKEASALDPDQFNAALLETIRGMFVLLADGVAKQLFGELMKTGMRFELPSNFEDLYGQLQISWVTSVRLHRVTSGIM